MIGTSSQDFFTYAATTTGDLISASVPLWEIYFGVLIALIAVLLFWVGAKRAFRAAFKGKP